MTMLWSAKNNAFIPDLMLNQYESCGWDMSDCTEIDAALVAEFMGEAPVNQVRVTGVNGLPEWASMPVDTSTAS